MNNPNEKKRIRVFIAKPGLDGHDVGAKVISLGLRDAGMEVIYSGIRWTPEEIATVALHEDVDVVGLSSLSGAHKKLFPRVVELLREKGLSDVLVIGGGNIPDGNIPYLEEKGIKKVWGPGSTIEEIADHIRQHVKR
ncbi:cobalamin B12-binding domain-containing protein [Thermodesulfobacteriota bacterium]